MVKRAREKKRTDLKSIDLPPKSMRSSESTLEKLKNELNSLQEKTAKLKSSKYYEKKLKVQRQLKRIKTTANDF